MRTYRLFKLLALLIAGVALQAFVSCLPCFEDFNNNGSVARSCDNAVTDSGTVTCGGQTYRTVKIGSQVWMAENLNYNTSGSACYDNISDCSDYGRLYDWYTASVVCPEGWHLPSNDEWTTLINFIGENAGTKLRAKSWSGGTDDYGFSALPSGNGYSPCFFATKDKCGWWWTATEYSGRTNQNAWYWTMCSSNNLTGDPASNKPVLYSVRCIQTLP